MQQVRARRVFVSYATKDAAIKDMVADALRSDGNDVVTDDRLVAGDLVHDRIVAELGSCNALVPIMTPDSLNSAWVWYEIGFASALRVRVVPFRSSTSVEVPGLLRQRAVDDIQSVLHAVKGEVHDLNPPLLLHTLVARDSRRLTFRLGYTARRIVDVEFGLRHGSAADDLVTWRPVALNKDASLGFSCGFRVYHYFEPQAFEALSGGQCLHFVAKGIDADTGLPVRAERWYRGGDIREGQHTDIRRLGNPLDGTERVIEGYDWNEFYGFVPA